jgi:hypothetical protein
MSPAAPITNILPKAFSSIGFATRLGTLAADRKRQLRPALSRAFKAWIASRAAFHSVSPQRRNS